MGLHAADDDDCEERDKSLLAATLNIFKMAIAAAINLSFREILGVFRRENGNKKSNADFTNQAVINSFS